MADASPSASRGGPTNDLIGRSPALRPRGSPGVDEMNELVPKIQASTARKSRPSNEQPTTVPAPQKQYFGVLGQRHVICINGLPNNGKAFVARELGWYLEFFHGALTKPQTQTLTLASTIAFTPTLTLALTLALALIPTLTRTLTRTLTLPLTRRARRVL